MKFLCVECDEQMIFEERSLPGDGTLAASFRCPGCERIVAMLTNPMETQLVSSLGIKIGGSEVPGQPLELVRSEMIGGREDAFADAEPAVAKVSSGSPGVVWSLAAVERLESVPRFVRGMVKRIYTDYAQENRISQITPDVMDQARSDLGLEGM